MSTPLIGGRGALSLFDESGEQGVYRSPPKKNKKNGVAQVGRQVWRPTVQGYTIPVCKDSANECRICQACLSIYAECSLSLAKIIKKRGTMHKIGRKMMFLRMSGMICQNFCLNLHRFIRAV